MSATSQAGAERQAPLSGDADQLGSLRRERIEARPVPSPGEVSDSVGVGDDHADDTCLVRRSHRGGAAADGDQGEERARASGLRALIERESARRLARLGASEPALAEIARRRLEAR